MGLYPDEIFKEIKTTYCFRDITDEEWQEILFFLTQGGKALQQYDEYKKVEIIDGYTELRTAASPCATGCISAPL